MATPVRGQSDDARRHHYVPRFLLKNFAVSRRPGRYQIPVFDKSRSTQFITSTSNIAVELDYNAIEDGRYRLSLERGMSQIESDTAGSIRKIIATRTLATLTTAEQAILCIFAALQFLRGPDLRARFRDMAIQMRDQLREHSSSLPEFVENLPDTEEQKRLALRMIQESLGEFAQHFASKQMVLFQATGTDKFLIGDSPVTLHNSNDYGPYGNIGLAVRGIQIHIPISPDLTLAFWCPTLIDEVQRAPIECRAALARSSGVALIIDPVARQAAIEERRDLEERLSEVSELANKIPAGEAVSCRNENVEFFNALQVAQAERYVMSADQDFSLVRRMIADSDQYRSGRRSPPRRSQQDAQ